MASEELEKKRFLPQVYKRQNIRSTPSSYIPKWTNQFKMAKIYPQTLQIKLNAMSKHIKGKEIYLWSSKCRLHILPHRFAIKSWIIFCARYSVPLITDNCMSWWKIRKPNETQHDQALTLLEITQLQVDKVLFPLGIVYSKKRLETDWVLITNRLFNKWYIQLGVYHEIHWKTTAFTRW